MSGLLTVGGSLVGFDGVLLCDPSEPPLPSHTIRCKFNAGYTPTMGDNQTLVDADENIWDISKSGNDWSRLFMMRSQLLEILGASIAGVTDMSYTFFGCTSLTSVPLLNTSSVTDMSYMFDGCTHLTTVPLFNTSSVTNMKAMFETCRRLTSVPVFDTSHVADMSYMFNQCESLTAVPLLDTSIVTSMDSMFRNCYNVESGALALYQQASSQATPPSSHAECFTYCGDFTVTGRAERAQIPSGWK